jgi:hypothetical protein
MSPHVHHLWPWICPIDIAFLAIHTVAYHLLPAERLFLFLSLYDSGLKFCLYKCNSLHSPKRRNQMVTPGLLGGNRTEPPLPIHLPGNAAVRTSTACLGKCGSLPSCCKIILFVKSLSSNWERKSFLVPPCILVC